MQVETKTFKNQRKGFVEVTDNFYNKFSDQKSPQDGILSWLIQKKKKKKKKKSKAKKKGFMIFSDGLEVEH